MLFDSTPYRLFIPLTGLMKYPALDNFVNGSPVPSDRDRLDVISPLDGTLLSSLPLSASVELDFAVTAASKAQPAWAGLTQRERSQFFFTYRELLRSHMEELAGLIHEENGKTLPEARAEIDKAMELTEFACSLPQLTGGEVLEVSRGFYCSQQLEALGVVASITPFNFPCMVPHWTIPVALALGNAMILKPSEQVPLSAGRTAELLAEAGLPAGIFNVLHGDRELVEAICDHPRIAAVTFVGSTPVAQAVYARASAHYKRVLAMGGAKNHLVLLPDADPEYSGANITASMAGCAGQRCMAAASLIAVGDVDHVIERICEESRAMVAGENLGAVISTSARDRIESYITEAEEQGARVLVDGRNTVVPGCEEGSYVGATVIDQVTPQMRISREEVFGPVLSILRADSLDAAIAIENESPFGNAAVVYTQDGDAAQRFTEGARSGMVGINVGVPVPREPFGFGGWNDSRFGAGDITGTGSISFWTQAKKITSHWIHRDAE